MTPDVTALVIVNPMTRTLTPLFVTALLAVVACDRGGSRDATPAPPRVTKAAGVAETPASTDADRSTFEAQAASPEPRRPFHVAVIADINGRYGSTRYGERVHQAVAWLVERRPDLVLCAGDMVAGQQPGHDYRAMWRAFHLAVTEPLAAAGVPLAVTPGNHDGSALPRFADERRIYLDEWRSRPRPPVEMLPGGEYPLRYAFTAGPARFIALDATAVGPLAREQRQWLREQLESTPARPLTVVFGHLPLYPVAVGREREVLADAALEALLVEHDVDLYLSGHHHAYYPARRGDLRLVAVPSLVGPGRPLIGTESRTPAGLLWLELSPAGIETIEALTPPAFATPVAREHLPDSVEAGGVILRRDDVPEQ